MTGISFQKEVFENEVLRTFFPTKNKRSELKMRPKNLFRDIHYCGEGYKGQIVKARGLKFCGLCGKEFRR